MFADHANGGIEIFLECLTMLSCFFKPSLRLLCQIRYIFLKIFQTLRNISNLRLQVSFHALYVLQKSSGCNNPVIHSSSILNASDLKDNELLKLLFTRCRKMTSRRGDKTFCGSVERVERDTGIEPAFQAWEARVLPLY